MRKIRIGKDVAVRWSITTNGESEPLAGRKLSLQLRRETDTPKAIEEFETDGAAVVVTLRRTDLLRTGRYRLTLWENKEADGQTVVDSAWAFALVALTELEDGGADDNIETESVELQGADMEVGVAAAKGGGMYLCPGKLNELKVANTVEELNGYLGTCEEFTKAFDENVPMWGFNSFKATYPMTPLTVNRYTQYYTIRMQGANNTNPSVREILADYDKDTWQWTRIRANTETPLAKFTEGAVLNTDEKILSKTQNKLTATLSMEYDATTGKTLLKGKNGVLISEVEGAVWMFPRDVFDTEVSASTLLADLDGLKAALAAGKVIVSPTDGGGAVCCGVEVSASRVTVTALGTEDGRVTRRYATFGKEGDRWGRDDGGSDTLLEGGDVVNDWDTEAARNSPMGAQPVKEMREELADFFMPVQMTVSLQEMSENGDYSTWGFGRDGGLLKLADFRQRIVTAPVSVNGDNTEQMPVGLEMADGKTWLTQTANNKEHRVQVNVDDAGSITAVTGTYGVTQKWGRYVFPGDLTRMSTSDNTPEKVEVYLGKYADVKKAIEEHLPLYFAFGTNSSVEPVYAAFNAFGTMLQLHFIVFTGTRPYVYYLQIECIDTAGAWVEFSRTSRESLAYTTEGAVIPSGEKIL